MVLSVQRIFLMKIHGLHFIHTLFWNFLKKLCINIHIFFKNILSVSYIIKILLILQVHRKKRASSFKNLRPLRTTKGTENDGLSSDVAYMLIDVNTKIGKKVIQLSVIQSILKENKTVRVKIYKGNKRKPYSDGNL